MGLTSKDLDYMIAEKDFFEFLRYVYILEAWPGRGKIPFEPWPHLLQVARDLNDHQLVAWLKSRQLGCSWLIAAYTLWLAMYHYGVHVPEMAQTEDKAKELIIKQKYIYENLPPELQRQPKSLDNQLELLWPENDSWIRAYASTKDAVRSLQGSLVWFDECDFHEYFDAAYSTAKATVDDNGGKIVLTSTANPDVSIEGSLFQSIYVDAHLRGFHKIFYGWRARPDRDDNWHEKVEGEATDPYKFKKEHAETEQQALAPPDRYIYFRHDILEEMKQDVRPPLEIDGNINIYQKPQHGVVYAAASDVAHGVGGDYSVTGVVNVATGYMCAEVASQFMEPTEFAIESMRMLEMYGNPLWGIEDNDQGSLVIKAAQDVSYPALYEHKPDNPGWHTGVNNRFLMWGELQYTVHQRGLVIPSETGLKQFYTVIRNEKKKGRPEAQGGQHDDYPMMFAIIVQIQKDARVVSRRSSGSGGKPVFIKTT